MVVGALDRRHGRRLGVSSSSAWERRQPAKIKDQMCFRVYSNVLCVQLKPNGTITRNDPRTWYPPWAG